MIHVTEVHPVEGYKLAVSSSDGSRGIADMSSKLNRRVFAPLRDPAVFAEAFVADGTVCWPGDIDIAPESIYALAHELPKPESIEDAIRNEETVNLRALRELLGVTQAALAEAAEMSQGDVSKIEARSDHRLSTLRRAVTALGGRIEVVAVVGDKRVKLTV